MKFEQIHNNTDLLLLQCISGSKAYGLNTPQSDTDIKGVYCLSRHDYYSLHYAEQVNNESNDIVYYELKRYIELLLRNNPNILELLNTPPDSVLYRHPVLNLIDPQTFLSKLCLQTFAGYALTQVKKAAGLNKKIFNPVAEERKTLLEFCYFISGQASIPLQQWLNANGYRQEECGLAKINHARDVYALYHQTQACGGRLEGIVSGDLANDVRLSPVPENIAPLGILSFNKDGYSAYCKDYKEYWEWVGKRNDIRYRNTLEHGKNYDAKNMMHTFRLLNMAAEIATEQQVNVRRPDRDFLLRVRQGEYTYEALMDMVNQKMETMQGLYASSPLPDEPDAHAANELLVALRTQLYAERP